jgi:tetratricopeptide (TPR) repeat protein
MYEHRVYLPSAGAFAAVAAALGAVPALATRRAWLAAALALSLPLAALTVARNRVWQSELSLWADAASKSPHKARPLNNVGCVLFARGDARGALSWYERALAADPGYLKAWFNAGEALQALGDCTDAVTAYERFLVVRPEYPDTYLNLATCYERLGRGELAARLRTAHADLARQRAGAPLPMDLR